MSDDNRWRTVFGVSNDSLPLSFLVVTVFRRGVIDNCLGGRLSEEWGVVEGGVGSTHPRL